MSDIKLSVALDTGSAKSTALDFVKTLNDIEGAGEKLIATSDKIRSALEKVGTGAKYASAFINKYKTQLEGLAKSNLDVVSGSDNIRNARSWTGLGHSERHHNIIDLLLILFRY